MRRYLRCISFYIVTGQQLFNISASRTVSVYHPLASQTSPARTSFLLFGLVQIKNNYSNTVNKRVCFINKTKVGHLFHSLHSRLATLSDRYLDLVLMPACQPFPSFFVTAPFGSFRRTEGNRILYRPSLFRLCDIVIYIFIYL